MAQLQPVRGTHDLLPEAYRVHHHVVETARRVCATYGYAEMATPLFEFSEVFCRTLGDTSDIVTKEMYTFQDRGGDSLTLRPEGTAAVARAFISNGLGQNLPWKVFYQGPMFRYERPQKGRQRQFHQFGVEFLGVSGPEADVETIACGAAVLRALGVLENTTLEINTLGDRDSRAAYRETLVAYLRAHADRLSEDSRERLERNPLRILDSKDEGDRAVIADAPLFADSLTPDAQAWFAAVQEGLAALGLTARHNPHLVRGLDYYDHTAFEFTTTALGAQGTVLAGGRYDSLIESMGGPATCGVGFAAGVERLTLLADEPALPPGPVVMVPLGDGALGPAMTLAETLRQVGVAVDMTWSGNLKKRLKRADRLRARLVVMLGEDELARGEATLRHMESGAQETVPLDAVAKAIMAAP